MSTAPLTDPTQNPNYFKTYAPFPDWDETVNFVVNGIRVQAVATHAWRRKTICLTQPFEVSGIAFDVVDEPPLFALGASRLLRRKRMAERGETERDDTIRMGIDLYKSYRAYLKVKPAIDAAQARIKHRFQLKLERLTEELATVTARTAPDKRFYKELYELGEMTQKQYQTEVKEKKAEVKNFSDPLDSLRFDMNRALSDVRHAMIAKQKLMDS